LTQAKHVGSLISILYTQGYFSPAYQKTAQAYHNHYLPIEKDTTLPLAERKKAMLEWWTKHKELLIKEGLTKDHIYQAMQSAYVQLREGYQTFFSILQHYHIPLVILSAGGLGVVSIEQYLKHHKVRYDNISLIGNDFIRDEHGKAIDIKLPLIHPFNKSATLLQDFPEIDAQVQARKNVILL
jgi:HAD superfamily hydrolase (TIGR01544 family)